MAENAREVEAIVLADPDNRVLEMKVVVVHHFLKAAHLRVFEEVHRILVQTGEVRALEVRQIAIWGLLARLQRCAVEEDLNADRQRCCSLLNLSCLQIAAASATCLTVLCSSIRCDTT